MITNNSSPNPNGSTEAAATTPAETQPITPQEFIDLVRTLKLRIPEYGQLPTASRKSVQRVANIHPLFKVAAIGGIAASSAVATVVGLTADEVHAMDGDADAWDDAINEVRALLKGMISGNIKRRHRVGLAALQSYSVTRQLVRHEANADLLSSYDEMKRTSRLRRRRRETAPDPGPVPQQPHTP